MRNLSKYTDYLDRNAEAILTAATGLMLTFFITFIFALSSAVNASAESGKKPGCQGRNLLEVYAESDPEKLTKLREEAVETANGQAIFWKIDKPGLEPSWLLGTMHMADDRIARLEDNRLEAFDAAGTVIVENTETLNAAQASAAMLEHRAMTLYTDGTTLADRLDEETLAKLKTAAEARGIPFSIAQVMQPWLVATSVALPVCELEAKRAGAPVLDALIANKAKAEGKELIGLESIREQFSAMHRLPESFHLEALKETLEMGSLAEDVIETMKQIYLDGRIGMIQPLTKLVSPRTTGTKEFADFNTSLITERNKVMAERSLPYLEKGGSFIAVGALHLPGETGLVEAFREAGYEVAPADLN